MAAPALRDTLNQAVPATKEEPIPPATPISAPDATAPRFSVRFLEEGIPSSVFQALILNNRGEVLCITEDREPFPEADQGGKRMRPLYRTVGTKYHVYREGKLTTVAEMGQIVTFRPLAFNDRGQILGFEYDIEEIRRATQAPRLESGRSPSGFLNPGMTPAVRNTRLTLWENGRFRPLNIAEALIEAGMPARYAPFLESAMIAMNSKTQILVGLQNLYLWENGKARRIGTGGVSTGERFFINERGTVVRRGEQYRPSPDGASVYPVTAIYSSGNRTPRTQDFGFGSFVVDLNSRDELLVGRMYLPTPDTPRMQFTRWQGSRQETLFAVNGRTPARMNRHGIVTAWRQKESAGGWSSLFATGNGSFSPSVPILWDGRKLYDLQTLLPTNLEVTSLTDINDRNEILAQVRVDGKLRMALLVPESPPR
ncbi:MAG: hypothetical protein SFU56_06420 [Capsulimonadales bacterium]|nr:hypothetical protein [Capsulimonadales bacterium]